MSPRPKLITPQGSLQEAIITVAWKQIGESGAASLSLRAIARELNITAPAIYNYYPSRDDLVTTLIIQAYTDFGDAQMSAVQAVSEDDPVGRLLASGRAYRAWALTYPERFHLIFGTPIPGYVAPEEKTLPVAARSMTALLGALEALHNQGRLRMLPRQEINPEQQVLMEERRQMGGEGDLDLLALAVLVWSRVHGFVALEISHNLPPYGATPDTLYQYALDSLVKEFVA
jgi:AcrR family transcriptional regulator